MSVINRHRIRRDAEEVLSDGYYLHGEPDGGNPYIASHIALARHCLALLAALQEADSRLGLVLGERDCWHEKLRVAEAKLATVPALVQILHRYYEAMALERGAGRPLDPDTYTLLLADAREALAAWEAAQ